MRVLIVDDNTELLRALERMVRLNGHTAVTAHSFPAAVHAMEVDSSIDVVLSDYDLGSGSNGHDVEAAAGLRGLRTIILTGNARVDGPNVLHKPCSNDMILAALGAVSGREKG